MQRYLERFGPVTETDIAWWTGLTKARVRGALVACGAVEVELEAGAGWIAPGTTIPPLQANVALLPGLDPTPMGYKERAWFLGPHQDALFDRNGNIGPTIFVDGRIVGGWAVDAAGAVVHRLLEPLPPDRELAVQAEAAALTGWLNGTSVIPRFRTPLERELTA